MRRVFLSLLLAALCGGLIYAFKQWTDGFRPAKCLIEWPFISEWEISSPIDREILSVLNEPFSYFAKGNQSFVFLSRNGKYVLKLFYYNPCCTPFGEKWEKQIRKWIGAKPKRHLPNRKNIVNNFTSCHLAYRLAQKQTGLVFVHLNPKKNDLPILKVKDRWGRTHPIDPARYRFALQRKVEPLAKTLLSYRENIQPWIESYLTLLQELKDLGLVNLDPKIGSNFGTLEGRVVQIDIGNFNYCPEKAAENMTLFQRKFQEWLEKI